MVSSKGEEPTGKNGKVLTITESTRIMPIMGTDVSALIGWYTSTVDDDAENDESDNGDALDGREHEFHCEEENVSVLMLLPSFRRRVHIPSP